MSLRAGLFITFEGGEGAGKSTAARRLAEHLRGLGREVVLTREPGGTPGAEAVRDLLLNPATNLSPLADTLLHFAARADHVQSIIAPAMARGAIVICDRFHDSTMAYQGYGMGVDRVAIAALIELIDFMPDVSIFLEVNEIIAKKRLATRGGMVDRYELMGSDMMARIAAGFQAIVAADPARCVSIDANGTAEAVFQAILAALQPRLNPV